jgi:hypothetical protein
MLMLEIANSPVRGITGAPGSFVAETAKIPVSGLY